MSKKTRSLLFILVALFSLFLMTACNGKTDKKDPENNGGTKTGGENNVVENDEPEEVTIRWAHQWGQEHFDDTIGQYLTDAFPHVTIEVHEVGTDHPDDLEKMVAGKNSPDIVTMGLMTHINVLKNLGLDYDMSGLIEQRDFDLSRIEPSIVEFARNQDPNQEGGLYGLLAERQTYALHYNTEVFDKLGVDYPTDNMTWEEITELAKELSVEVDGVQYRGLDLDVPYDAYTQFSQVSIDPETDEALIVDSEAYRRYLDMIDEVTSIPGNYPQDDPASLMFNWGSLFDEGNIAMSPRATHFDWLEKEDHDIVTYPAWEGYEGIGPIPNGAAYSITDPSEHKEVVLDLLAHLFSDEVQIIKSKKGHPSTLVNASIHEVFAEENDKINDKHLDAIFMQEFATGPPKKSKYAGGSGDSVIWTAPTEFLESGKDVVEFLRILQEQSEEILREQKQSE